MSQSSQTTLGPVFLSSVLPSPLVSPRPHRPHVTLTYAQSLDARIAGVGGKQLILSGKESMIMTHWLRTMHDGILIGVGTAKNDNPNLNVRHLHARDQPYPLPRPIVLDTNLCMSPSCNLIMNYQQSRGREPWIFCSSVFTPEKRERMKILEQAGAKVFVSGSHESGLDLNELLATLRNSGINSLMVEGGQHVISSFMSNPDVDGTPLVDILIVTVAPTLVGAAGVGVFSDGSSKVPRLKHIASAQFGPDTVFACKMEGILSDEDD